MSTAIFKKIELTYEVRPYKLSAKGLLTATSDEKDIFEGGMSFHIIDHEFYIKDKAIIKNLEKYKNRHVFITGIVHVNDSGQEVLDIKGWKTGRTVRKKPSRTFRLWEKVRLTFLKMINCFTKDKESKSKEDWWKARL